MTIRVLHLGSPNGLYGAERWILALVRHLDRGRVDSHVGVISDEPGLNPPLLREAEALQLPTVAIEAHGRFNPAAVRGLRQYLVHHRIDILHTHFYKTDLAGLLAVRGTKCRLVTTPHGWSTRAGLALRVYEQLDRLAFRYFDAVVPLSPELHRELDGRAGKGLVYIQNGVDIGEIDAVETPAPELRALRDQGAFIVGYVGQLIPRKGIDTLIRAFARLELSNARLVLIGEGGQRTELEALARELDIDARTHFMGYRNDRIALMRGMHVFVLPSMLEGIPRCLMEAMAAHVPVVATDIPGCRDLIDDGRTGLLVRPGEVDALVCAIRTVHAADPGPKVAAAREKVEADYSAATMATRYTDLYMKLR